MRARPAHDGYLGGMRRVESHGSPCDAAAVAVRAVRIWRLTLKGVVQSLHRAAILTLWTRLSDSAWRMAGW